MTEFTIERRMFLLGAILAPFAGRFAAAGVKPRRSGVEFVVSLSEGNIQFSVLLTEDGDLDEVTYTTGGRTFPMHQLPLATIGNLRGQIWRTFECKHGPHSAKIRFRVGGITTIGIDYLVAKEVIRHHQ